MASCCWPCGRCIVRRRSSSARSCSCSGPASRARRPPRAEARAMELVVFTIFASMALGGAILLVSVHNLVRSVLAMILSFVGVAGLYLVLQAEFIAAIQVLVYVGAVAVLVLFAIMLTQRVADPNQPANNSQAWLAFAVSLGLFAI